ncbi:MAG TPA: MotA/TolQ/ExbB proton channel family protein [Lachnospiraceae bacterium]|nr:MotA/TolQ/ExbB proton channel family protein [Lachnospiraceae bacterium]
MNLSFTKQIMRTVMGLLEIPVVTVLLLLMAASVVIIGSFLVEIFTERRRMKEKIPVFVTEIEGQGVEAQKSRIADSGLLGRQKDALKALLDQAHMPADARESLAKQLLYEEEVHYRRIVAVTDMVVRIAPMFGLLGTLIPLGPGLMALSQGDTATLAQSLTTAFDTTAAGLVAAAVCFVVGAFRKRWYDGYAAGLETIMEILLSGMKEADGKGNVALKKEV